MVPFAFQYNIYLEPVRPEFWGFNPPKQGLVQSKQGSFGFQVYGCLVTYNIKHIISHDWFRRGERLLAISEWGMTIFIPDYIHSECLYQLFQFYPVLCPEMSTDRIAALHPDVVTFQDSYNTPLEHTPGNPRTQLWKDSLYSLLRQVKGCVPKVCWNNLRNLSLLQ